MFGLGLLWAMENFQSDICMYVYIFLLNEVVYYSKGENNQDMTLNL